MIEFDQGRQPCDDFKKVSFDTFTHQCPHCNGTRAFCANCNTDHHSDGWQLCWELQALRRFKEAFAKWRAKEMTMHDLEVIEDEIDELIRSGK